MKKVDMLKWGLGIFLGVTMLCVFVNPATMSWWEQGLAEEFAEELREAGYVVKQGSVESPIAIFDVGYSEFIEIIEETPVIVLDHHYLYAFSQDYIWGYKYTLEVEPDHPLSWIYPFGDWHHDKS